MHKVTNNEQNTQNIIEFDKKYYKLDSWNLSNPSCIHHADKNPNIDIGFNPEAFKAYDDDLYFGIKK